MEETYHKNYLSSRDNCRNLRMVTCKENNKNRDVSDWTGEKNGKSRFRRYQIVQIKLLGREKRSHRQIAEAVGVNKHLVSDVLEGVSWRHVVV